MTDLLKAVQTVTLNRKPNPEQHEALSVAPTTITSTSRAAQNASISSPEDALEALRSSPSRELLNAVLKYLCRDSGNGFEIRNPGPKSAKIINELVSRSATDYWSSIGEDRDRFLSCLRSVAGLSAVLARLSLLASQAQTKKTVVQNGHSSTNISDLLELLKSLLTGHETIAAIWKQASSVHTTATQRKLLWKELISTVSSGKIVSIAAQAEDATGSDKRSETWLVSGTEYAAWLGSNIAEMASVCKEDDHEGWHAVAQLCGRSFSLGYSARLVEVIYKRLALVIPTKVSLVHTLASHFQPYEQRQFMDLTLRFSTRHYSLNDSLEATDISGSIAAAAALIKGVVGDTTALLDRLQAWIADPTISCSEPLGTRRATLAVLNENEDCMQSIMEANLKLFGESLFIKHSPVIQQEACAQVLLLAAGYVHRRQPMFVFALARSSTHLNGTSNRLSASSNRARVLGLWVATAISELVDKPGQKMNFDMEEAKTAEAVAYMTLVRIEDKVGGIDDLIREIGQNTSAVQKSMLSPKTPKAIPKSPAARLIKSSSLKGPRVIEITSEDEEEEEDLIPYAKPDSDPEDDDEDPTMITRNKAKAPVYVRDLIAGLQDSENYERHHLALTNAASLIRRKTGFGKEISDHAVELATILAALGDPFDIKEFSELRLRALIALLISDPRFLAPWLARQVFEGDYSLSQRATLLSVLGLGSRELAGHNDEDELNPKTKSTEFPSKRLPDRFHKVYTLEQTPVQALAQRLEQTMIQPLALQAADKMAGPNALKVRTFSSRMDVEKKRQKAIPNALAKVVAESFFFPLTGRWWQNVQAYGASNIHFQPFLLSTYLKTLAIMLHASGPSTLSLPQMTNELWDLLLSVRTNALNDVSVMEAVLFSMLTMLEINEDQRRIAEDNSRQLMETQEWAELVFEKLGASGDKEGERLKMLAASVLLKTREIVDKYQRLLVGDLMDY